MSLAVVLVSARNPLNIGAVARAMSNFGCKDLRLVQAYRNAVEEARSAPHAEEVLKTSRDFDDLAAATSDCSLVIGTASLGPREARHEIVRLEAAADRIHETMAADGRVAVLFGSEKSGLSNDDLAYCHWLLTIPSRPEHGSMNLGQAVAVCLYELAARGREIPELDNRRASADAAPADAESEERLIALLLESLQLSGYVNETIETSTRLKTQRLVRRMKLSRKDAGIWQGMLRQIRWKLSQRE
jgi:TrmH family RNA methyltransferase